MSQVLSLGQKLVGQVFRKQDAYTEKPAPHGHVGENGPRDLSTLPPGAPPMAHTLWVLSPGACQVLRVVTRAQTRASLLASASMGATAARLSSPSRGVAVNRAPRSAAGVSSGARSCRVSHCRVPGLCPLSFQKACPWPRVCPGHVAHAGVCSNLALRSACTRVCGDYLESLGPEAGDVFYHILFWCPSLLAGQGGPWETCAVPS